ncbi:MsnO8 family LLM class oxidoreductase [Paenibacillus aurantius]|uniref:MsnO8 family LLM class oxidoreductase n=1 Tax=Paenibacillus aurantius TaxID=2918900 RepID=A0AA96LKQ3_9BACL|nr:MsnO8 family LLM class oxidoreductase [Paenibacillus aurantius]WNQ13861.1 MsnO8 family LLM class oxidoreductase [Paenibacillus aurantius]
MKLSVLDLVPVYPGCRPEEALRQAAELAQLADRVGYTRYWAAEHHDMAGLACPAPEVLLSHIGALTERIRLGSGAVLLPHYKPIKLAETFRLLSALYPGRIDMGLGRAPGGSAHVTMALSGNFLENVRRLPESLKALTELLEDRYVLEGAQVTARPIPSAGPELWMLGTNEKSAAYAAEFGTGYVFGRFMSPLGDREAAGLLDRYRTSFRPSKPGAAPRVILTVSVFCAPTEMEARRLAEEGMSIFRPDSAAPSSSDERDSKGPEPTDSGYRLIAGTPEQVRNRLAEASLLYGAEEMMIVCPIPDYSGRLESYRLLAEACL